ncbi:hypothetical protein ACO0SA_004405 [Hanseniaspora valbyensis]
MSQVSNTDHSFDSSFLITGDISILPENIDELVQSKETNDNNNNNNKENDLVTGTRAGTPNPHVSAAHVFSRVRGSNRNLKLPKTFTNINKLKKAIYKDHKFLRESKVQNNEQMRQIIMEKCKIWKVINDPNINDRIMSLDIPFIMDKLVDEYYKNVNTEKATPLTVVKHRGKNLSQFEYNLIYHNELTLDNLLINNFTTKKNRTVKYTALKENYKRYFDVKNKRIVIHHMKNYKEVIPPMILLETVLQIHLLNNHIKLEPLYRQLLKKYFNVTRQVVRDSLQLCNHCKIYQHNNEEDEDEEREEEEEEDVAEHLENSKSESVFKQKVKPWERVQLEVYDLKGHSSKIILLKDNATHFEWVQEMDKSIEDSTDAIVDALIKWLMSTATVIPVTFFSIAIDCDHLHEILDKVGSKLNVKLGAVYVSTLSFTKLRAKNEDKHSKLELKEVYENIYNRNNDYLSCAGGCPRKLLFTNGIDFTEIEQKRKAKQDKYSSWGNVFIEQ